MSTTLPDDVSELVLLLALPIFETSGKEDSRPGTATSHHHKPSRGF
jgi:hypothetical protein